MMGVRTEEEWRSLFELHQQSGLSQSHFCQEQGLCPKYFSLRRKQLLGGRKEKQRKPRFIQAQPPVGVSSRVNFTYRGTVIELAGYGVSDVAELIKQLV